MKDWYDIEERFTLSGLQPLSSNNRWKPRTEAVSFLGH